ncbi:argininosuccinate synthase%2C truncation [Streptococcus pneumoniae]|nr:argininosuccinate synthase%2C truncation [Streptococcus pneumoniae]CJB65670.1 argininosuccinate synthase%2C truncation [Streptococcus pneumoniae]CJQ42262.1 argininosuccinate synthase%2C truncation [Streptococcus pneumoniae]CJX99710.1 argininosuccinate synthase%2C truncation [Streptococcus pneumoniae]CRH96573.1 argininosuccinate synthase%2C truncation [Streptococcus pneumoniae]
MSKEKVILAYSGGLDTSVAITWLKKDYDVVSVCMDPKFQVEVSHPKEIHLATCSPSIF